MITVLQASMVEEITEHFKRLPLLELMTDQWVEHRRKQLQQNKEGVQDTLRHAERVVGLGGLPGAQTSSTATGHEKGSRRRFFCRVHI